LSDGSVGEAFEVFEAYRNLTGKDYSLETLITIFVNNKNKIT
jgi:hypothetical protein